MKDKDNKDKFLGEDDFLDEENSGGEEGSGDENIADDGWEYFDDCPICQAMKNGTADTLEGLTEAFREAERQGFDVHFAEDDEDWDDTDDFSEENLDDWLDRLY